MEKAITECIKDNILADFLRKYRAEAKSVSIYEYDEEKHMRFVRKEGMKEGEKRFAALMQRLMDEGRFEDARRAAGEEEFRQELYREMEGKQDPGAGSS